MQLRFKLATMLILVAALAAMAAAPAFASVNGLTIDDRGTLGSGGGQITVSGTVTCSLGDLVFVQAQASQLEHGQVVAVAFPVPSSPIGCTGAVQQWQTTLTSVVPFKAGPASVVATAFGGCCQYPPPSISARVQLHKD